MSHMGLVIVHSLSLSLYSRIPLGLVHLRFYCGRVLMRFLEVACVRISRVSIKVHTLSLSRMPIGLP